MITAMFKSMSPLGDKDEVLTRRIGEKDNEMDPVGLLYPADKSIAAIVFPIAETLKQVSLITAAVLSGRLYVFLEARVKTCVEYHWDWPSVSSLHFFSLLFPMSIFYTIVGAWCDQILV